MTGFTHLALYPKLPQNLNPEKKNPVAVTYLPHHARAVVLVCSSSHAEETPARSFGGLQKWCVVF